MAEGGGSAMVMTIFVSLLVLHFHVVANAASYTVGDDKGWTYNMVDWPQGKDFKAGDTLVFNYDPKAHNVVVVNKDSYEACTTPKGAKVYTTGKDQITLAKGQNSFICNFTGHCESGMKITVVAE